ncbi:glycosyltransferase family 2 protein [Bacteroides sp. 214]|uniref:glycosyltransferase family 2 protein n=1 Tax=Bacteroides sp. 214 TaxID=2302935 RepID=UPI001EF1E63A|nr:glycosyltransferase family 2 protein [Bacteroides sp. 214]
MISVIIPTHKRADLLAYELERIYMQKGVDFEVIVVNDIVEADKTDSIVERFPGIIYIKDDKIQGPSNKHKAGFSLSKGEYLYMPDDDDYLTDEYFFKKAVDKLREDEKLAFVSGNVAISHEFQDKARNFIKNTQINILGRINGAKYLQGFQSRLQKPYSTVSTIYRKKAFVEMGANEMQEMSDSSMYMLALLWGDAYILKEVVAVYRIRESSLTSNASYSFMMNVIEQKEKLYFLSKNRINNPSKFWYNQFRVSYNFFPDKSIDNRLKMINWGIMHAHGSVYMYIFCFVQFLKLHLKRIRIS